VYQIENHEKRFLILIINSFKYYETMKKIRKITAYFLIGTIGLSSCIGPFKLTNTLFAWNETIGSKWKNELVFILFIIVPIYEIAILVDGLVINSIEVGT